MVTTFHHFFFFCFFFSFEYRLLLKINANPFCGNANPLWELLALNLLIVRKLSYITLAVAEVKRYCTAKDVPSLA